MSDCLHGRELTTCDAAVVFVGGGKRDRNSRASWYPKFLIFSWTAPKTFSQIGSGLIHLLMSQMERDHGQGSGWIF
jgi:hypothetical protein